MSIRALAITGALTIAFATGAAAQSLPGPPWPQAVSPGSITLRWYPDELGEGAAQQTANLHCATTGRRAAMAAVELDGSAEIATYRCQ